MRKTFIILSLLLSLYSCTEEGYVDWDKVGSYLPDSPPPKSFLSLSIAQPTPLSSTTAEYSFSFYYFLQYGEPIDTTVISRGVCWSIYELPTILSDKTDDGNGLKSVKSQIEGLTPRTTYYLRAYATLLNNTILYSEQVIFTTLYITTTKPTQITSTSIITGGEDCYKDLYTITERGVCWSHVSAFPTVTAPNYGDGKTSDGSGSEDFISSLSELVPSTDYYLRAYITTSEGVTHYGNTVAFKTSDN